MSKVGFVSLGCLKALIDSERILTQLRIDGYDITNSYDGEDVVVVNTCGLSTGPEMNPLRPSLKPSMRIRTI